MTDDDVNQTTRYVTMDLTRHQALQDIHAERGRQERKWGQQNHPDGTGGEWHGRAASACREACQEAAAEGRVTWRHIFTEEFAEAMAEADPAKLRAELVQCAAVATAWIEHIDRRTT